MTHALAGLHFIMTQALFILLRQPKESLHFILNAKEENEILSYSLVLRVEIIYIGWITLFF